METVTLTPNLMHVLTMRSLRLSLTFVLISGGAALAQDTLFYQNFDAFPAPDLPSGWNSVPPGFWTASTSVAGPGSGRNNIVVSGGDSASLASPTLDFNQLVSGEISYLARRTSTFPTNGLIVEASVDGGQTFSIVVVDSGLALPQTPSSYDTITAPIPASLIGETSVQLRFRTFGSGGGNCRVDDVVIAGSGRIDVGSFGFSSSQSTSAIGADSFRIGLDLSVLASNGDLHGLQFDIAWPTTQNVIGIERGAAVSDEEAWDLAARLDASPGRILLLSRTNTGLPPGSHSPVLTLLVSPLDDGTSLARTDTLSISGIIGSRSSDTGDDAYLTDGLLSHDLFVLPPTASFEASVDSINFGLIEVDSVEIRTLIVTNPLGTIDLVVDSVASDVGGVTGVPGSFSVAPGDSLDVSVTANATVLPPGPFSGYLRFFHSAASSPDSIRVSGTVGSASSRGDVNDDGITDLVDLVIAVDHVVGTALIDPELEGRIDLYPFPSGDGGADVRDLTVLVRAINSGSWPDGLLLPGAGFLAKGAGELIGSLFVVRGTNSDTLRLGYRPGMRAVHIVLGSTGGLDPEQVATKDHGQLVRSHVDTYRGGPLGAVGILAYSLEGPLDEQPEINIATIRHETGNDSLRVLFATGVDLSNRRVHLEYEQPGAQDGDQPAFLPAFPQPFSLSAHRQIVIQAETSGTEELSVRVYDILGRTVLFNERVLVSETAPFFWDGRTRFGNEVSPGIYFVTFSTQRDIDTVPVVVTK